MSMLMPAASESERNCATSLTLAKQTYVTMSRVPFKPCFVKW